jgi:4-carboxymuconolactone decarboxylase
MAGVAAFRVQWLCKGVAKKREADLARYDIIDPGDYSGEQQAAAEVIAGSRGSVRGPFQVFLHNPALAAIVEKYGAYARFNNSLPDRLNELAVCICGRYWGAHVEWVAHSRLALEAGIAQETIDALHDRRTPEFANPDEQAVYDFCTGVLEHKQVDDAVYGRCLELFDEAGVIDLMATLTHYTVVSLTLNAFQVPVPEGAQVPPFGPGR